VKQPSWRDSRMFPWRMRHVYPLDFSFPLQWLWERPVLFPYLLLAHAGLYLLSLNLDADWPMFLLPLVQYLFHSYVLPTCIPGQLTCTLKMEATGSSEPLGITYMIRQCCNPEDHNLKYPHHVNLKSHETKPLTTFINCAWQIMHSPPCYVSFACRVKVWLEASQHMAKLCFLYNKG
jgi:hypothetical protein